MLIILKGATMPLTMPLPVQLHLKKFNIDAELAVLHSLTGKPPTPKQKPAYIELKKRLKKTVESFTPLYVMDLRIYSIIIIVIVRYYQYHYNMISSYWFQIYICLFNFFH